MRLAGKIRTSFTHLLSISTTTIIILFVVFFLFIVSHRRRLLIVVLSCRVGMPTATRNVPTATIQTANVDFARRIVARGATAARPTTGVVIASAQEGPSLRRQVHVPRPVSTPSRNPEKRMPASLHLTIPPSLT